MKRRGFKLIFVFVAILGLLVFLYFTNLLSPLKEKIYQGMSPVASYLYSFGSNIRNAYKTQTGRTDLSKEVEGLEEKVSELVVENAKLKEIEEENKRLREHLDFLKEKEFNYKMAHVISKGFAVAPEEVQRDIIIDKGEADGLYPGLAVVNSQGVLVGKIFRVEEKVSRVSLSSDSECKLAATIQNSDRTIGIASGRLGLTIKMDFIAQDEEIEEGDLVVTSGLEENIPRGLVIGDVSRIDSNTNEIWKSVVVEPLADFDDLIMVSVILP